MLLAVLARMPTPTIVHMHHAHRPRFRQQRFDVVVAREDAARCVKLYNDLLAASPYLAGGAPRDAIELDERAERLGVHASEMLAIEQCFEASPQLGPRRVIGRGVWGEVDYLELHQQELLLDMDTEFNAREEGGFTWIASAALVAAAALNTVEHVFQARRAFEGGHCVLLIVHLTIFLSGITYAVVMVSQACFFVDALLDALSLLYISQLDQQAFRLVKELRMVHLLEKPWAQTFSRWRRSGLRQSAESELL
eukprot:4822032-Prymnesium_polylepis.1